jgi:hypothetical protein
MTIIPVGVSMNISIACLSVDNIQVVNLVLSALSGALPVMCSSDSKYTLSA